MFEKVKIESVEVFEGEDVMFDLSVEGDKTYVANGFAVHNSDYCLQQDGRIYRINEPDLYPPPAHFNCRSTLIPITADEQYKISKPLAIKPAEGFYSQEKGEK